MSPFPSLYFTSQPCYQVGLDRLWFVARRVALEYRAVGADEELGEVPLDRLGTEKAGLLRLEVFVERVRIRTVHVDLCEQGEGDAVVPGAELFDLRFAARLLVPELITGETEHDETPVPETVVERLQSHVLWREAALACNIDDEQRLVAVDVHLQWLPVDRDEVDVVEAYRVRIHRVQFPSMSGRNVDSIPSRFAIHHTQPSSPKGRPLFCPQKAECPRVFFLLHSLIPSRKNLDQKHPQLSQRPRVVF